jgi:hypothetical protein
MVVVRVTELEQQQAQPFLHKWHDAEQTPIVVVSYVLAAELLL